MNRKTGSKKIITSAAVLAVVLLLLLFSSCESIKKLISDGVNNLIDGLGGATESPDPYAGETTEDPYYPTDGGIQLVTEGPTDVPATRIPVTASPKPVVVPFNDTYVPSYGTSQKRIVKNSSAMPERYWRATITRKDLLDVYDALEKMVSQRTNEAFFTEKVKFDDIAPVFSMFMLDHPEVFWYTEHYQGKGYTNAISSIVLTQSYNESQIKSMQKQIDDVANKIIASIPDNATDIEAELIIFDWLSSNLTYDLSAPNTYTLYGALVDRRCVCQGYAEAFQYLCAKVGIRTTTIVGMGFNGVDSEPHKWAAAEIGGKWYLVEPTWADPDTTHRYLYFNNSSYIAPSHTPNEVTAGNQPQFTATDAEYLNYYGLTVKSGSVTFGFEEVFMRAVTHFIGLIREGYVVASVMFRAENAASAQKYTDMINSGHDEKIFALIDRVNAGLGREYIIFGDAEIIDGDIVTFYICKL